ncbi:MAG: GDSL family lipase [Clostridia bacterium]|nr:GDSL family lipase [Clostridia bacterium]
MTVVEKIIEKQNNIYTAPPITLAFLGDSVTQGCFELYPIEPGNVDTVYDPESAYHNRVKQMLNLLYPRVPFTVINAGISGDRAISATKRLESHVLKYNPDLTVVCFGLNDAAYGADKVEEYIASLREIFTRLRDNGSAVIFMTPNTMALKVNQRVWQPKVKAVIVAKSTDEERASLDLHIDRARKLCAEMDVPVCDCYAIWKQMAKAGVDTTSLLSNDINHPTREMHYLFAYELVKMIIGGEI